MFNVPCHRPNNQNQEWFGTKVKVKQVVHLTVLKTDMSQKVPFILGTLQNIGLDDHQVTTGTSLSEALIFASINPQYDNRLFMELRVQTMKTTSAEYAKNIFCTCSELVSQ